MNDTDYETLQFSQEGGVAHIAFRNPPVNLLSVTVMTELRHLLTQLAGIDNVRVIVFESADPDFFLAHVDMTTSPGSLGELMSELPEGMNVFQAVGEQLRHQPQVTIVKPAGQARGGGAEFVIGADMAFAAIGKAGLGQIESLMGTVPGGGATQYLAERIGRNRALEVVLGADLFDAETAERYGWINRAIRASELDAFVHRLAVNIAALPEGVIAAVKRANPRETTSKGSGARTTPGVN